MSRKRSSAAIGADLDPPRRGGILIVGNSHTDALAAAVAQADDSRFHVVNLASFFDPENRRNKELKPELGRLFEPDHVFCSFGGSEHNVFGLLEAPVRLDFILPGRSERLGDRQVVPYGLVRETLHQAMKRHLSLIVQLRDMFSRPVTHICTPPPFRELAEGQKLPRVFQEKMHLGIAPAALRQKLYLTHSAIARDFCARAGLGFLEAPRSASDEGGFLKPEYCTGDPTHANAAYGRLVLDDILRVTHEGS